ncbi:hypothetical protein [Streptomyces boninensis]|uniref:hypothetical protein n=1 Tax=Streptomyces boninensis TaxID=2039455 RepID=UPI003B2102B6
MRTSRLLAGVAALAAPLLVTPSAPAAPAEAVPNNDPSFLQVYDANVENLPVSTEAKCPGDWHDLMYYMRLQKYRPDIYLVQQVGGQEQLKTLLTRMKEHFGESYAGVVAEANPDPGGGSCGAEKAIQTNAVIWRTDRLSLKLSASPKNRWQAQRENPANQDECIANNQARSKGVKALLHDKASGKDVTAASFHWPTISHGGMKCAPSNAGELSNELTEDGYGVADLYVAGGDTNHGDRKSAGGWTDWYAAANADVGGKHRFRDAGYAKCAAGGGSIPDCLAKDWTHINDDGDHRRIDFLLARRDSGAPPAMTNTVIPGFDEGDAADKALTGDDRSDLDYSDHRAVGARVGY